MRLEDPGRRPPSSHRTPVESHHTAHRAGAITHRRIGQAYAAFATFLRKTFRHRGLATFIEHFWRRDATLVFAVLLMAFVLLGA